MQSKWEAINLERFFKLWGLSVKEQRTVKEFHRQICQHLEMVITGKLPNGKRNLIINLPPRHGKTYLVCAFICWAMGIFPDSKFIYVSCSQTLATQSVMTMRDIICSEFYQTLFRPPQSTSTQMGHYQNSVGGEIYACGSGGTVIGMGAGRKRQEFGGCIVIDDIIKPEDSLSPTVRNSVNYWFRNTLLSRKNNDKTPIIIIAQRLHKDDLPGHLLETEPELWHVLKIPALDQKGEALWEETKSKSSLEHLKRLDPFTFFSQYQQEPIVAGGQVIKTSWFRYYSTVAQENESIQKFFIVADTAQKTKEINDFSVLTAFATHKNNLYLVDMIRGKWEAPELRRVAKAFWEKHKNGIHGRPCSGMWIEDKASGTGLIQDLQVETGIPVIPIQRVKDKLTRLMDVLHYIEAGRFLLPLDSSYGPNIDILSEAESFRGDMSHAHDDIIDTLIDGINVGLSGGGVSSFDWV